MVGITSDVLKHMSIFFFQGTMNIQVYISYSIFIVILVFMQGYFLKSCVIWQFELCYTMLVFLTHLYVCGRSMFHKRLEIEVWYVCVIRYNCLFILINSVTYVKE